MVYVKIVKNNHLLRLGNQSLFLFEDKILDVIDFIEIVKLFEPRLWHFRHQKFERPFDRIRHSSSSQLTKKLI
jgi:hypothetical protein